MAYFHTFSFPGEKKTKGLSGFPCQYILFVCARCTHVFVSFQPAFVLVEGFDRNLVIRRLASAIEPHREQHPQASRTLTRTRWSRHTNMGLLLLVYQLYGVFTWPRVISKQILFT